MAFLSFNGLKEYDEKIKSEISWRYDDMIDRVDNHSHSLSDISNITGNIGDVLVNGGNYITLRAVTNNTALTYITYNTNLMTTNTLAFWNGAYNSSNASNLTYCNKGAFGSIVTKNTGDYLSTGGGTLTGNLTASVSTASVIYNKVKNSLHEGCLYASETGNFGLFSNTCSGWLIRVDTAGVAYIPRDLVMPKANALYFGSSTSSYNCLYNYNSIGTTAATFQINVGVGGTSASSVTLASHFRPSTNNVMSCGTSGFLWTQVFAKTTTISSSDRNVKKDFRTFDSNENYEKFFMDLKPMVFKYIDGTSNRDHFGYISQDVEESLYKYGFDDKSFAGFCKNLRVKEVETEDGKIEEIPVLDENGNKQYDYALRYSEFISLNTHMIQKLYKKIELLEAEIEELKSK